MRRVVTVLILVTAVLALAACGSAPSTTTTTSTTPAAVPAANQPAATTGSTTGAKAANADIYSPTQTVNPGDMISQDTSIVPTPVLANVAAGKPMIIFYYDPTTKVTGDQVEGLTKALKGYTKLIQLVSLDYTTGIASSATSATIDPETQKIELFAASLGVTTTPFTVFTDKYGRVTYKFAGVVDSALLKREIIRATK